MTCVTGEQLNVCLHNVLCHIVSIGLHFLQIRIILKAIFNCIVIAICCFVYSGTQNNLNNFV